MPLPVLPELESLKSAEDEVAERVSGGVLGCWLLALVPLGTEPCNSEMLEWLDKGAEETELGEAGGEPKPFGI